MNTDVDNGLQTIVFKDEADRLVVARTPAMARGKLFTGREPQSGVLRMVRWNFDIPPDAARDFVADMLSYHTENDGHRRDQIAARQARLLNDHLPSRRMTALEVGEVFMLMREWC